MQRSRLREVPADLSGVAERLGRWRQGRKRGDRIPATLWVEAAELASRYGVNRTARVLGLDYYHLKKRVKTSSRTGPRKSAADVRFEELPASVFAAPLECVIQFENKRAHDCGSSGGEPRPRTSRLWDATSGGPADAADHFPDAILVAIEPVDFRNGIDGLVRYAKKSSAKTRFKGPCLLSGIDGGPL